MFDLMTHPLFLLGMLTTLLIELLLGMFGSKKNK